jgi:hypothetical protein
MTVDRPGKSEPLTIVGVGVGDAAADGDAPRAGNSDGTPAAEIEHPVVFPSLRQARTALEGFVKLDHLAR